MSAGLESFALAVLQSIGWTMLHIMWIGAVIGLFYGLLRALTPSRVAFRYWSGLAALTALLLAACALFTREWQLLHKPEAIAQSMNSALHISQTGQSGISLLLQQLTLPLALLWAGGVLLLAIRLSAGFRYLNAIGARAQFGLELDEIVQHWRSVLGVSERVVIKVSDEILVPCVFGVLRPMLLLPAALLMKIDRTQLELVILHELVHVKRWDAWLNALQICIETALFFHPLVHWISRHVRNDRELLCDQAVLSVRAEPLAYARALLNLEEYRQAPPALAIAFNSGQFSERVKRILGRKDRSSVRLDAKRSVGAVLLSSSLVLLGTSMSLTMLAPLANVQDAEKIVPSTDGGFALGVPISIQLPNFQPEFAPISVASETKKVQQLANSPAQRVNRNLAIAATSPNEMSKTDEAVILEVPAVPQRLLELDASGSADANLVPRANIQFAKRSSRIQAPAAPCMLRTGTRICRNI